MEAYKTKAAKATEMALKFKKDAENAIENPTPEKTSAKMNTTSNSGFDKTESSSIGD